MHTLLFVHPKKIPAWFWKIIDKAQKEEDKLFEILMNLPEADLFRFEDIYENAALLFGYDVFLKYIPPDLSEDGFKDVTEWIVGQGKDYYMDIWNHPERIPGYPRDRTHLAYVVDRVYHQRNIHRDDE